MNGNDNPQVDSTRMIFCDALEVFRGRPLWGQLLWEQLLRCGAHPKWHVCDDSKPLQERPLGHGSNKICGPQEGIAQTNGTLPIGLSLQAPNKNLRILVLEQPLDSDRVKDHGLSLSGNHECASLS